MTLAYAIVLTSVWVLAILVGWGHWDWLPLVFIVGGLGYWAGWGDGYRGRA